MNPLISVHREDIKAALRKKHGSIVAFEALRGLPKGSTKDVFHGKSRPTIAKAIADELGIAAHILFPDRFVSHDGDSIPVSRRAHRLIHGAK